MCNQKYIFIFAFHQEVRDAIASVKAKTEKFSSRTVVVALNYGSRAEVLRAAEKYAEDVRLGRVAAGSTLDWKRFSDYLWTAGFPDPDLVVRTSGESRLSNFLMLQSAYAELYFTDVPWPDFGDAELRGALAFYASRERRFGRTSSQIRTESETCS